MLLKVSSYTYVYESSLGVKFNSYFINYLKKVIFKLNQLIDVITL